MQGPHRGHRASTRYGRYFTLAVTLALGTGASCTPPRSIPTATPQQSASTGVSPGPAEILEPLPAPDPRFEFIDRLVFVPLERQPASPQRLLETDGESWAIEPSLSPARVPRTPQSLEEMERAVARRPRASAHRRGTEIIVRRKPDGNWRSLALADIIWYFDPIVVDPVDSGVIWVGCNNGSPDMIVHPGKVVPSWEMDIPLVSGRGVGGLARIDVQRRSVAYFGTECELSEERVEHIAFDERAVWVWGRYPLGRRSGIARYDRQSGEWAKIRIPDVPGLPRERVSILVEAEDVVVHRRAIARVQQGLQCAEARNCSVVSRCRTADKCQPNPVFVEFDSENKGCERATDCRAVIGCEEVAKCEQVQGGTPAPDLKLHKSDLKWNLSLGSAYPEDDYRKCRQARVEE